MIKDKPISSAHLAISWVEFLAKFRTIDHMLPESRHLNIIEYYSIDVIAFISIVAFVLFYIIYRIFRFIIVQICCCRLFRTAKKSKSD